MHNVCVAGGGGGAPDTELPYPLTQPQLGSLGVDKENLKHGSGKRGWERGDRCRTVTCGVGGGGGMGNSRDYPAQRP